MSWRDLVLAIIVIVGIILFLYGSNYYNAIIGWAGVALILAGIVAEIVLEVSKALTKKGEESAAQKP